jgi:hypothetical protein
LREIDLEFGGAAPAPPRELRHPGPY